MTENLREARLPGATIDFSSPASGSVPPLGAGSAVTNASGLASVTATANSTAGAYVVTASAAGGTSIASFNLTNQIQPSFSGLNSQTVTYGGTVDVHGQRSRPVRGPHGGEVDRHGRRLHETPHDRSQRFVLDPIRPSDGVLNASSTAYNVTYHLRERWSFSRGQRLEPTDGQPEALTVTAVANTKIYDGTTARGGADDHLGQSGHGRHCRFLETYSTQNVGTGLTLTPSGTVDDGNSGNNYIYTFVPVSTGAISVAPLTITASPESKTYGQSVSFGNGSTLFSSTGLQNGEDNRAQSRWW